MLVAKSCNTVWVTLVLSVLVGCEPPRFYDCEGVVTRDGRPIPNLQITFAPDIIDSVRMPLGLTDSEGRFEMFSGRNMGVPPGTYRVYVEDPSAADGRQTSDSPDYLYVIHRYSPDNSDFKYVADRDRLDFELALDTKDFPPPPEAKTDKADVSEDHQQEEDAEIAPNNAKPADDATAPIGDSEN